MYCIFCGSPNPDVAAYCRSCGKEFPKDVRSLSPNAATPSPSASDSHTTRTSPSGDQSQNIDVYTGIHPATVAPPTPPKPYLWGRFQGWAFVVGAAFAFFYGAYLLQNPGFRNEEAAGLGYVLWSFYAVPLGIGLLKRRWWAINMVWLLLAICVFVLLGSLGEPPGEWGSLFSQSTMLAASGYYYEKRRAEFR